MRTSHMHLHFPTQSCPRWHCRNALLHLTENVCYATLFHLPCTMSSPFIGELMPQQSGENSCHLSPATNKTKCMHVIRTLLSPHQNKWRGNAKKRVPITLARSPDYYSKGACWRDVRTPVCLNFHEVKIKGSLQWIFQCRFEGGRRHRGINSIARHLLLMFIRTSNMVPNYYNVAPITTART